MMQKTLTYEIINIIQKLAESDNLSVNCKVIDKLIHPYFVKLKTGIPQKIKSRAGGVEF